MPQASASLPLATLFDGTRLGAPRCFGGLTLVPLLRDQKAGPDVMLLEEGIAQQCLRVTEVSEAGIVNKIRVEHAGKLPLLILDGEQVLGEKQNRAFNASFVVRPGVSVDVPVSCVERGRWRYRPTAQAQGASAQEAREAMPSTRAGEGFTASGCTLSGEIRSRKLSRVTSSPSFDADQRAVWRDVDEYLTRTQVRSKTGAYDDGYRARARHVEEQLERAKPEPGQVGMAAVAGGCLVGMDVFGSTELYAKAWKKVLRGMLADDYGPVDGRTDPVKLVRLAMDMLTMPATTRTTLPGCGETILVRVGVLAMGAVALDGELVHAYAAQV